MEMHQIRYFLAVARTLNFTRAAAECNVAQPSLTRAVKLLEQELGGDLFARERNNTHLTDLGTRMQPFLRQSYESSIAARDMARSLKRGEAAPLRFALSRTIPIELVVDALVEVQRTFKGLELSLIRRPAVEAVEIMKKGDADLLVAGPIGDDWERFDRWPLMAERHTLVVAQSSKLVGRNEASLADVRGNRLLFRHYCEQAAATVAALKANGIEEASFHRVDGEADVIGLVRAGIGIGILPQTMRLPAGLRRIHVGDLELDRTIYLYAVAGRPRAAAAAALMNLLRSADYTGQIERAA